MLQLFSVSEASRRTNQEGSVHFAGNAD